MAPLQEKRNYARHQRAGRITLLYTHSQSRQIEADLLNFSEQGISFFSRRPLMPGTTFIVRAPLENYQHMPAEAGCQLRSMGLVTIKWCQEGTLAGRPIHAMGAVYIIPY